MLEPSPTKLFILIKYQDATREDANVFKKALAFCRKRKMTWTKNRADSRERESFGLQSMSSTTSSVSRENKVLTRPRLRLRRGGSMKSQGHELSPSYSYTESSESDPFITSPLWLKAESPAEETI